MRRNEKTCHDIAEHKGLLEFLEDDGDDACPRRNFVILRIGTYVFVILARIVPVHVTVVNAVTYSEYFAQNIIFVIMLPVVTHAHIKCLNPRPHKNMVSSDDGISVASVKINSVRTLFYRRIFQKVLLEV